MDKIFIENLEVFAHHGYYEYEREMGQKFIVNATFFLDLSKAARGDDLNSTVNYGEASRFIADFMTSHMYNLIETLAENICEALLIKYPVIEKIILRISKPQAPIPLRLDCPSIEIERGYHDVYLSLGSNMGDREHYLKDAISSLAEDTKISDLDSADIINTKPYGKTDQEDFLNTVVYVRTLYTPDEMLDICAELESDANRVRDEKWGPRTLDVDILLYDQICINTEKLTIPHYDMHNRYFVLKPLTQLNPAAFNPVFGKSAMQLLLELKDGE